MQIKAAIESEITYQGVKIPAFLYGTAWKEAATEALTTQALSAGFRGIDTANQRRHYFEEGVGAALQAYLKQGEVQRSDLFIQTKFTYVHGQDHRLPYDRGASFTQQVAQSFRSSQKHLGVDHIDSYVLHGPSSAGALTGADWETWSAMEGLVDSGQVKLLGVSNVHGAQLEELYKGATIKPAFVQNRCYASTGWDKAVRQFCNKHGIIYQGFSLLTANPMALQHDDLVAIGEKYQLTPAQTIFCFAMQIGMIPLTGSSSPLHVQQDLACFTKALAEDEVRHIEHLLA